VYICESGNENNIKKYRIMNFKYDLFTKKDQEGQEKLVNQLQLILSACTDLTIEQHYIDKCTVDVFVTATTKSSAACYAFEAKDRTYSHNRFDEIILEIPKYESLMERCVTHKPMYVHTFSDDWLIIWDLSKLKNLKKECRYLPKTTVEDRGKEWRWVYLLPIDQCVYSNSFIVS
jgi:hypothetical protein